MCYHQLLKGTAAVSQAAQEQSSIAVSFLLCLVLQKLNQDLLFVLVEKYEYFVLQYNSSTSEFCCYPQPC